MSGTFTISREKQAKHILDSALEVLRKTNGDDLPEDFEYSLKECWDISYTELRSPIEDMLKHKKYQPIAVRYMLRDKLCIPDQFKGPLAKVLNIKDIEQVQEFEIALQSYWNKFNFSEY